ncbi:hypothetical protein Nepgr_027493 [Nepenthes gracilis]|uniref:Uncharacterized protein n=1 Tax=Nepenthes gracilis TaxID=150966 RepID=A0AAD3Y304_NEPGR|nr:hypothetical protein Nepgr_027493 [Nepenthes gracilis]
MMIGDPYNMEGRWREEDSPHHSEGRCTPQHSASFEVQETFDHFHASVIVGSSGVAWLGVEQGPKGTYESHVGKKEPNIQESHSRVHRPLRAKKKSKSAPVQPTGGPPILDECGALGK